MRQEVLLLKEHLRTLIPNPPKPRYLYHYTSAQNLAKILEGGVIRFYDAMKDREEIDFPLRTIWRLLQSYSGRLPFDLYALFNAERRRNIGSVLYPFACCFCQSTESAFMWWNYADEFEGASIRIRGAPFSKNPSHHAVYPMLYERREIEKNVRSFCRHIVGRDWIGRFSFKEAAALSCEAALSLCTFLVCVKRPRFCREHEWRAMIMRRSAGPWQVDPNSGRNYVEIALLPEYVSGIVLGSKCPLSPAELRDRLRDSPYKNATITRSKLRS